MSQTQMQLTDGPRCEGSFSDASLDGQSARCPSCGWVDYRPTSVYRGRDEDIRGQISEHASR